MYNKINPLCSILKNKTKSLFDDNNNSSKKYKQKNNNKKNDIRDKLTSTKKDKSVIDKNSINNIKIDNKKDKLRMGRINISDNNINELKDILKYDFNNMELYEDYINKQLKNEYNIMEYMKNHIIDKNYKQDKVKNEIIDIDNKINDIQKNAVEYYNRKYLEKVLYGNNKIYDDLIDNQKIIFTTGTKNILKQDYNNNATLYKDEYLDDINDEIINIYNKLLQQYYHHISTNLPGYIYNNIDKPIYPEQLYILNLLIKPYSFGIYNNIYNNNQNYDVINNIYDYDHIIDNFYNLTFQQSINFYQQFDDLYYLIFLSGYELSHDEIILLISYSNFDITNYNLNKYQLLDILLACIKHIYNIKYLLVLSYTLYEYNYKYKNFIDLKKIKM